MFTRIPGKWACSFGLWHAKAILMVLLLLVGQTSVVWSQSDTLLTKQTAWLLQMLGMNYQVTADPSLSNYSYPSGVQIPNAEAFFHVLLPSQGLAYDMQGVGHLHLIPREKPWRGPSQATKALPEEIASLHTEIQIDREASKNAARKLSQTFNLPVLLDHRIDDMRDLQSPVQANTLEDALEQLASHEGWQWLYSYGVILLMPGEKEQLLNLPNAKNEVLIFADSPLHDVATRLKSIYPVEFGFSSSSIENTQVTTILKGDTLGDMLDRLLAAVPFAWRVDQGKIVFCPVEETLSPTPTPTVPQSILLDIEILEVPEKRWDSLKVGDFLASIPPPDATAQEDFWSRVDRASGVKNFGKARVSIPAGSAALLQIPPDAKVQYKTSDKPVYLFMLNPASIEDGKIQMVITMQYLAGQGKKADDAIYRLPFYQQPFRILINMERGKRTLLRGSGVTERKKKKSYYLISLRTIESQPGEEWSPPGKADASESETSPGIQFGGEIRLQGTYSKGLH